METTLAYPKKDRLVMDIRSAYPSVQATYDGGSIQLGRVWMLSVAEQDALRAWLEPLGFVFRAIPRTELLTAELWCKGDLP